MSKRKEPFVIGEYYHIYNRGVDKRDILSDHYDMERLFQSFVEFNTTEPINSIYQNSFRKERAQLGSKASRLVDVVAYCINPNHFHLVLTPLCEKGVEKFMQRIGGYTKYFNNKYERSGSLFEDKFKSKYISTNKYLLHLSAYVNMNNRNLLGSKASKLSLSSLEEYLDTQVICSPSIVLDQFNSKDYYRSFCLNSWKDICNRKQQQKITDEWEHLEALLPS